jgi:Protein of unknown function (DUF4232)
VRLFLGVALAAAFAGFLCVGTVTAHEVGVRACRMPQLATSVEQEMSPATGQTPFSVQLTNRGRNSCVLAGHPTIRLRDPVGVIPFVIRRGGDQMVTADRPARVVVRPGRSAFGVLNRYRCDLGNVRTADTLRLALPGAVGSAGASVDLRLLRARVHYCGEGDPGSTVSVSPFVPTIAAGLRRR